MRILVLPIALLGLSACAATPAGSAGPAADQSAESMVEPDAAGRVTAMLAGAWSNAEQYANAPDAMKRPPAPGDPYEWIDLQTAAFFPVRAPAVGEHVVYLEWRGADGAISRQRIWAFREGEDGALTGMDFYTFADPEPFADRGREPGAFEMLSPSDLIGYPDGCTLAASGTGAGYRLEVSAQACVITARSGRQMGIEAVIEITPDLVTYREAGIMEGGVYAFLVPGGPAYAFRRAAR